MVERSLRVTGPAVFFYGRRDSGVLQGMRQSGGFSFEGNRFFPQFSGSSAAVGSAVKKRIHLPGEMYILRGAVLISSSPRDQRAGEFLSQENLRNT